MPEHHLGGDVPDPDPTTAPNLDLPEGPETLACPSCGGKLIVRWSTEQRDGESASILHLGHKKPICAAFDRVEDPIPFIELARSTTREAKNG